MFGKTFGLRVFFFILSFGQETDWLVTVMRPEGVVYFICVAPREEYNTFNEAFTAILDSLRFKK